ncbi:hypothetical protein ACM67B_03775 [Neisseria sp. CCUG17229]|uniref:hypothetical protein n=1 Tax=Neisseria sp. CCUG17229 TaxID=3392036 RepID=UPI003A0FDDF7
MSWISRELQNNILHSLRDQYPNPLEFWMLEHYLDHENNDNIINGMQNYNEESSESEDCSSDESNESIRNLPFQKDLIRNLLYLEEHSLISIQILSQYEDNLIPEGSRISITAKGIDFIEQDGGLSAILNVVTVKLHSETIQQLLTAKISEAEIPEEEKNQLKEALKTVQNSALETLTEKAIETIPAMQVIGFLKAVVGL